MESTHSGALPISTFGADDPDALAMLHRARGMVHQARIMIEGLPWPGPPGCELGRLDAEVGSAISVTHTVVSSLHSALASAEHLCALTEVATATAPSPWIIGPSSRSLLLSTCRVLWVLLPQDDEIRVEHARRIAFHDAVKWVKALNDASGFTMLSGLRPEESLVAAAKAEVATGGKNVNDTTLVYESADLVAVWAAAATHAQAGSAESLEALPILAEQTKWLWNQWSGIAHGLAWPTLLPNRGRANVLDAMPGNWVADFAFATSWLTVACDQAAQALTVPAS